MLYHDIVVTLNCKYVDKVFGLLHHFYLYVFVVVPWISTWKLCLNGAIWYISHLLRAACTFISINRLCVAWYGMVLCSVVCTMYNIIHTYTHLLCGLLSHRRHCHWMLTRHSLWLIINRKMNVKNKTLKWLLALNSCKNVVDKWPDKNDRNCC